MTFVANVTDVNDKIYDARARRRAERRARGDDDGQRYIADTDRPRARPARRRADGHGDDRRRSSTLIQDLIDSDHAYAVAGRRLLPRARRSPTTASSRTAPLEEMDQGEDDDAGPKEDPQDFALWKAQKPGEDTAWDAPVGPRPARAGTSSAPRWPSSVRRRGLRHPRRRQRPDLPAPRERDRPDRGGARRAAREDLDAQRDAAVRPARRCRSRWATSARCRARSTSTAATRWSCTSSAATTASRSTTRAEALEQADQAVARMRELGAPARPGRRPPAEPRSARASASTHALADDFNTPAALRRGVRPGRRRRTGASTPARRAGRARCGRCSGPSGLDNLLDADDDAPDDEARAAARPSARRRGRRKDFATRRRPPRRARGAGLAGARHARGPPSSEASLARRHPRPGAPS